MMPHVLTRSLDRSATVFLIVVAAAGVLIPLSNLLLPAVALDGGGMLLAVLAPVIGMAGAPLLWTIETDLPVFGIGGDLLAVIVGTAPALAVSAGADGLPWLILRGLKHLFAIAAAPFDHRRFCRTG